MLGTQTMMSMRQFLEDAEKGNEKETGVEDAEVEEMDSSATVQKEDAQKEAIQALRILFEDFEEQIKHQTDVNDASSSESEEPHAKLQEVDFQAHVSSVLPLQEKDDVLFPKREPQLYLCDVWIQPVKVMLKPKKLSAKDKARANVAKNCRLVTLMTLETAYGSVLERYQKESEYTPPSLHLVVLTDEEVHSHIEELAERNDSMQAAPAAMPPHTILANHLADISANGSEVAVVKDMNLKCIMSCP